LELKARLAQSGAQDPPDVLKRREDWFEGQPDLDPDRLVFIDETWISTKMARTHGRCARGERLRVGVPHGHWKTTTFVAGLRLNRIARRSSSSMARSTGTLSRPMWKRSSFPNSGPATLS
jgi:hypothetical protein